MKLAGDIGGTKTVLALVDQSDDKPHKQETYQNSQFRNFDEILDSFLPSEIKLNSACFGIAGPVLNQRCHMTNLDWVLDAATLKQKLQTQQVKLLNDMEAMAVGMLNIPVNELIELNPNATPQAGNIAVIAAGTGLGEAILYWDGEKHHPIATEGGHSDFAPLTEQQDKLLAFLRRRFTDHVSYERILCGNGFSELYDFLCEQEAVQPNPAIPADNARTDRNAVISQLGLNGEDIICQAAVNLFLEIYGAEAGNLALKSFAIGGIFVGGGIAPKILPVLKNNIFLRALIAKGRYTTLLSNIPIKVSTYEQAPLLGAKTYFK